MSSVDRLRQVSLYRPPDSKAVVYERRLESKLSLPLGDRLSAPLKGKAGVIASVIALLQHSRPATVFWRIVTAIVNTVYGPSFWAVTHVRSKVSKRANPALTDSDSSSTVEGVKLMGRIKATPLHRRPDVVNFGIALPMLRSGAPTRLRITPTFVIKAYSSLSSAIANTVPVIGSFFSMRKRQHSPASKSFISQISHVYNNTLMTNRHQGFVANAGGC